MVQFNFFYRYRSFRCFKTFELLFKRFILFFCFFSVIGFKIIKLKIYKSVLLFSCLEAYNSFLLMHAPFGTKSVWSRLIGLQKEPSHTHRNVHAPVTEFLNGLNKYNQHSSKIESELYACKTTTQHQEWYKWRRFSTPSFVITAMKSTREIQKISDRNSISVGSIAFYPLFAHDIINKSNDPNTYYIKSKYSN
jgi:hypothetical protein